FWPRSSSASLGLHRSRSLSLSDSPCLFALTAAWRGSGNNRAFALERGNLVVAKAMFGQHRARVLAVNRRARAHAAGRLRELDRQPQRLDPTERRMLRFDDHVAGARLRIGKRLEHVIDRPAGNPLLLEYREPMRSRLGAKARRKLRLELVQVCHSIGAADETRIACKLDRIERFQRAQPVLLVGPADDDPAVARLECL